MMELYEVREMMAKELRGILHDEFNAYLEKYDGIEGDNRCGIYDVLLTFHRDPRELLYIDIAKVTAILRFFEMGTSNYLQQGEVLEETLLRYNFSANFLEWLIKKYTAHGMPTEVLIIEKVIERRGLHTKNNITRFSL